MLVKRSTLGVLIAIIGISVYFSFRPLPVEPGLTIPVAIEPFLNGNFPDISPVSQEYKIAFPNLTFNSPLTFSSIANTNNLIVGQRNGELYWFENNESVTQKNLFLDMSDEVGMVHDGGFLGLAIHPEFGLSENNYMYVYYTTKDSQGRDFPTSFITGFGCNREDYWGSFLILKRLSVDPVTLEVDPTQDVEMIKMRMFSSAHRGGGLTFGNDGFLYLATGDQSDYAKPQNVTSNLDGGVLRIDVNQDESKSTAPKRTLTENGRFTDEISGVGYGIPNDNPFVNAIGDTFEEYYTIGHRNPHRMTRDKLTGNFYIGEIGENRHEEINVLKKGANYGWPVYEGNYFRGTGCTDMLDGMPHESPLTVFPRSDANSVIGGFVYRGSSMPSYYGKYICADYGIGEEIWAVDIATGAYETITQFSPTDVISFGEDNDGELYLLSQGDNVPLYQLIESGEFEGIVPQRLSETGAFEDMQNMKPIEGLIPYNLIESFWSDGAEKQRWMAIPNNGSHNTPEEQISFSENGDWEFPLGAVLIKHFELPIDENNPTSTKKLETRFSVKASNESFYFLTYKWNETETDAFLLETGIEEDIPITKTDGSTTYQTWSFPSTADCISCHNPATGGTLGPRTRYLNSELTYEQTGVTSNQLVTLSHLGILNEIIDQAKTQGYQTYKSIVDTNASLDEKARSYLDLNCAYCHRPGATGERAQFDLQLFQSLNQTGLLNAGTNTPLGINGEKIIVPNDASKSILFHRMNSVDQTITMPPVAKNKIDVLGVELIEAWINQMEPIEPIETECTGTLVDVSEPVGSGIITSRNDFVAEEDRFKAFDNNSTEADFSKWLDGGGTPTTTNPSWIQITLEAPKRVEAISITSANDDLGRDPENFRLMALDNNGTFLPVGSWSQIDFTQRYQTITFDLSDPGTYTTYRLEITKNEGNVRLTQLAEMELLGCEPGPTQTVLVTNVELTPESLEMALGTITPLQANVLPSDATDKTLTWASTDTAIATVDQDGNVTATGVGNTTITVTTVDGGFTAATAITVQDDATNNGECTGTLVDVSEPVGSGIITSRNDFVAEEDRFKAFDNNSTEADFSKWLDGGGTPTTTNPSWIQMTLEAPKRVEAISITSANDDLGRDPENFRLMALDNNGTFLPVGSWSQIDFTQRYQTITFDLSDPGTYTTYRLEITKNEGNVRLTQLAEMELLGCEPGPTQTVLVTNVELTPESLEMALGTITPLQANVLPSDATDKTLTWASTDTAIATVDQDGNVTATGVGNTTITVTTVDGGFTAATAITVQDDATNNGECTGTLVDVSEPVGSGIITSRNDFVAEEDRFKAFDNNSTEADFSKWLDGGGTPTTTNPSWIQMTLEAPKRVEAISITSANDDLGRDPENFRLMALDNNGTFLPVGSWSQIDFTQRYQTITFDLSDPGTYTTYRLEITKNEGNVRLTQLAEMELLGCEPGPTQTVLVTNVELTPESLEMALGTITPLQANVLPSDATDKTLTWASTDTAIATVDQDGNVTATGVGNTTITVTTVDGGFTAATAITVQDDATNNGECTGTLVDVSEPVGSGIITSRNDFVAEEDRFKAFDNNSTEADFSKWLDGGGTPTTTNPSWIQMTLEAPKRVEAISITSANDDYGRDPKDFRLMASNGGGFTEIGTWSGENFEQRYQKRTFDISAPGTYTTYRLEITKNDQNVKLTQLTEIELLGCEIIEPESIALKIKVSKEVINTSSDIFSFSPNPVNENRNVSLHLTNEFLDTEVLISIYSIDGRLVDYDTFWNGKTSYNYKLRLNQALPAGIYLLEVKNKIKAYRKKLVLK